MSGIDYTSSEFWKGAPEDAQGFMPWDSLWIAGWWKQEGGSFYWCSYELGADGGWKKTHAKPFDSPKFQRRPSSPAWSGPQDGLPPVDCMVRVVDNGSLRYGVGEEGPVVAHIEDCAVVRMSYGLGCFEACVLAPALTPEQKAADQKEADILRIWDLINISKAQAKALYEAGLRFTDTEQPK